MRMNRTWAWARLPVGLAVSLVALVREWAAVSASPLYHYRAFHRYLSARNPKSARDCSERREWKDSRGGAQENGRERNNTLRPGGDLWPSLALFNSCIGIPVAQT